MEKKMKITKITAFLTVLTVALGSTDLQSGGGSGFAGGLAGGMIGGAMISGAANSGSKNCDCSGYQYAANDCQNKLNELKDTVRTQKSMIKRLKRELKKAGKQSIVERIEDDFDSDIKDVEQDLGYDSGSDE